MHLRFDELEVDGERWVAVSYLVPRPAILQRLTASERVVVELYANGLSAREIARERSVSTRTIANQISSAYRKLKVNSRTDLVTSLHHATTRATPSLRGRQ